MDGKYITESKKVMSFKTIQLLFTLANYDWSFVQTATSEELAQFINNLPDEIRVVIDQAVLNSSSKDANSNKDNYDLITIRYDALNKADAEAYKEKNLKYSSRLLTDFKSKSEMLPTIGNDYTTVAGLTNYPELRKTIEELVGLKELYSNYYVVKRDKTGGKFNKDNGTVSGNFDLELVGNFSNSDVSLFKQYLSNGRLRKVMTSVRGLGKLSEAAIKSGFARTMTDDLPYAALLAYYGILDANDSLNYRDEMMGVEKRAISLRDLATITLKAVSSNTTKKDIDAYMYSYRDKADEGLSYIKGINQMISYLVPVSRQFSEIFKMQEEETLNGSNISCFMNNEKDNSRLVTLTRLGIIKLDNSGLLKPSRPMTLASAIKVLFHIMEAITDIETDSLEVDTV